MIEYRVVLDLYDTREITVTVQANRWECVESSNHYLFFDEDNRVIAVFPRGNVAFFINAGAGTVERAPKTKVKVV